MRLLCDIFTTTFNSGAVCGASDYRSAWKSSLYLTEQSGHTQSSGNSSNGVPGKPHVHRRGPDDTGSRSPGIHTLAHQAVSLVGMLPFGLLPHILHTAHLSFRGRHLRVTSPSMSH